MNRGRHRSRKHVEPQPKPLLPAKTTIDRSYLYINVFLFVAVMEQTLLTLLVSSRCLIAAYSELGSDSLLNSIAPVSGRNRGDLEDETKSELPLRHFIDEWPKNQLSLSRESEATQMGLCVGTVVPLEQIQRQNSWVPISWEPSVGGPLGEALHRTSECKSSKDNSSTLGVLRGAFGSLTSSIGPGAESSNGLIAPGLMLPSLPALWVQHSIPNFVSLVNGNGSFEFGPIYDTCTRKLWQLHYAIDILDESFCSSFELKNECTN